MVAHHTLIVKVNKASILIGGHFNTREFELVAFFF
jgi:hypothetical protein